MRQTKKQIEAQRKKQLRENDASEKRAVAEILERFRETFHSEALYKMEELYLLSVVGQNKDIVLGRAVKALEKIAANGEQVLQIDLELLTLIKNRLK
jgi:hypothetical protein